MGEIKRFAHYGNRIKRDGTLLNINFETKTDAKLCCKLLNQMDKDQQEYIDELNEIFEWHKEHYGKSILDERLEFKSDCEKENEQLKQKIKELDLENNKLWETCYHSLQFARQEDITIKRTDKGHYKIYSKNVTPKDSPIISITAPSVLFNEYIINQIIEAINKIPPVQEKEVDD